MPINPRIGANYGSRCSHTNASIEVTLSAMSGTLDRPNGPFGSPTGKAQAFLSVIGLDKARAPLSGSVCGTVVHRPCLYMSWGKTMRNRQSDLIFLRLPSRREPSGLDNKIPIRKNQSITSLVTSECQSAPSMQLDRRTVLSSPVASLLKHRPPSP